MFSSDHILSFLLATLLHTLGLLLLGSNLAQDRRADEKAAELEASSVELSLASIEPAAPADSSSDGAPGQPPEAPLQPLDMPQPAEPPPPLSLPDKPAFTEALTPPPQPDPLPAPTPTAPAPKPAPAPTPAPAAPSPTAAASAATAAGATDKAVIQPAGGGGGAYGRIDAHPSLHRPIKPNYPIGARRRGEEGTVILDVVVAEDGTAQSVSRVATSGFPDLDSAAERAAAQARFKPGSRDGKPVVSAARITIIFRLRDA